MRSRRRGLTLVEVIVSASLFLVLSVVFVLTLQSQREVGRRTEAHSDAQRACLLALTRLRQELRGARVMIPGVGSSHHLLRYRRLALTPGGFPLVTAGGAPSWGPVITCSLQSNGDYLSNESPPKILGQLGQGGSVQFTRPGQQVLEVDIRTKERRVVSRVALPNS